MDISATASSGAEYEKYFTDEGGTTADELAVWGQIVNSSADVAIDGNVTGQHVDIAANSENSFISAGKIDADLGKINAAIGTVTVNMDGAYAVLGGEANVTIGKDAAVEATAADTVDTTGKVTEKALNISAQSTVKAGVGASTSAIKFANIKHSGVVPAADAAYAKTTNTANVVAGTVKSAGSAAVAADVQTQLDAAAVDQTTQVGGNVNDTTAINAAIVIADGSNSSKVEFADAAKATEISGDLDIGAASINSVDTRALVKGKESSIAATAVNVTNYTGTADVEVGSDQLPAIVILDSSIYGMIRILVAPQALRKETELAVLQLINGYNKKYKSFKYYLDDDGALALDTCVLFKEGEADGDLIYAMFEVIINYLNESYKNIMKTLWS